MNGYLNIKKIKDTHRNNRIFYMVKLWVSYFSLLFFIVIVLKAGLGKRKKPGGKTGVVPNTLRLRSG